jgi:predicted HD phosphohydrolase
MDIVTRIERLFRDRGDTVVRYGDHAEPLPLLAHALQSAQLAEMGGLDKPIVAAALLHDVGHLLAADGHAPGFAAREHGVVGAEFLAAAFDVRVVEPVRLHVHAKRYLVTVDPLYPLSLSAASMEALEDQGGCMDLMELQRFESAPFALDAVTVRRVADAAKVPGHRTPPLVRYLSVLDGLVQPAPRCAVRPRALTLG